MFKERYHRTARRRERWHPGWHPKNSQKRFPTTFLIIIISAYATAPCPPHHHREAYHLIVFSFLEPIFSVSRHGRPVIILGNYRYNQRSGSKGPRAQWQCSKKSGNCRATITTFYNEVVMFTNEHNHWKNCFM